MTKSIEIVNVNFHGQEIKAMFDGESVFVGIRQICENLGVSYSSQSTKVKEHGAISKGVQLIATPSIGGVQNTLSMNIDFLPLWLATISPNKVSSDIEERLMRYQLEAKDVLADHFFSKERSLQSFDAVPQPVPQTPAELILQQAQVLVEQERRTAALEAKTAQLEATLQRQEEEREESRQQLLLLPPASAPVKEKSLRTLISERVRRYFMTGGMMTAGQCYSHLYREYRARYGTDLKKRAENKSQKAKAAGEKKFIYKPLDIAEELGELQEVYNLACELFN